MLIISGKCSHHWTLLQLGNLYDDFLQRQEEAAAFYRQSAEKYVEIGDAASESLTRSNLGDTLRKLRRLNEARQEIHRAIECKEPFGHAAEPWKTWAILTAIETDADNPVAATEAKSNAIASYIAYRRDGGENHDRLGRIILAVTQSLLADDPITATSLLEQLANHPDATGSLGAFIVALQTIVAGSRDRTLADATDLDFRMAAEILFLIETLEKAALHPRA